MKRLLYISHRVPYPPDKGERIRAFHQIRALSDAFDVTLAYVAFKESEHHAVEALAPWCEEVLVADGSIWPARGGAAWSLLLGRSASEGYFADGVLRRTLRAAHAARPFDVAFGFCSSVLPYVTAVGAAANVLDLVDVDSAKWAAYAASARGLKRCLYRAEARAVAQLERRVLDVCDTTFVTTDAEMKLLPDRCDVRVIANGVDCDFFQPNAKRIDPGRLVFVGQMDYRPNVEAALWMVEQVWPALHKRRPDVRLTIVGRNPTPAVRKLGEVDGVDVTGEVADVRPHLWAASAVIVPLRTARGVQNKVLEAMAAGKATVVSPAALEGLELDTDQEVLLADTPDQWHGAIDRVLGDDAFRRGLEQRARHAVQTRYSWPSRLAPMIERCCALAGADVSTRCAVTETVPTRTA